MIIDPIPYIGTPVEKIITSGIYQHSHGTVKLDGTSLLSIDSKEKSLESLKCLIGRPIALCFLVLNKNLSAIQTKINENIDWLNQIFREEKEQWKTLLITSKNVFHNSKYSYIIKKIS
ncbi:unnamed protein product [Lasius platythorax]|uniref:Uncharacterized protein n=1 Tax=Lasius platythorax TaxID=488582 RepID=A0AAV2P2P7_9HYME